MLLIKKAFHVVTEHSLGQLAADIGLKISSNYEYRR
jgi:hypothetical protein